MINALFSTTNNKFTFGHCKVVDDVFMREGLDNWDIKLDNTNNFEGVLTTLGYSDELPELESLNSRTLGDRSDKFQGDRLGFPSA